MSYFPGTRPDKRTKRRKPLSYTPLTWVTNRSIARQLKAADCSVVGVFADIARDRTVNAAVRLRAAKLLALLLFGPRAGESIPQEQLDLSAIIAREGMEATAPEIPPLAPPKAESGA